MKTTKSGKPVLSRFVLDLLIDGEIEFSLEVFDAVKRFDPEVQTPLAKALLSIVDQHSEIVVGMQSLSRKTKRGRPKKVEKEPNTLAAFFASMRAPGKPGRPTKLGKPFDRETYLQVEHRRATLAEGRRTKPTIKAAIDSLNEDLARDLGKRVSTVVRDEYASLRSCYQRGKRSFKTNKE